MPYDHSDVARQIAASRAQALAAHRERGDATADAATLYQDTAHETWCARVQEVRSKRLMGVPVAATPLHEFVPGRPAGPDYTVVASDSSFVPPDKHRGSYCYLINVGRVMIRYGDEPEAELDSSATHYIDPLVEGEDWMVSGRLLQAQCALRELTELHAWADRYGADLALVDGSLMQSALILSPSLEVQRLMRPYRELLSDFQRLRIPVIGYVSKPASQSVIHAARLFGCRIASEQGVPACDSRCARPECSGLWAIDDGGLFWEMLEEGWRSPVFQLHSDFIVHESAPFWEEMGFCYLATTYEMARLEFPLWVLEDGLLDRVQSIILSQCLLGEGYPNALTLAHNFAVLRAEDRESYFFLLERAGLIAPPTEKARGKRATGGRI